MKITVRPKEAKVAVLTDGQKKFLRNVKVGRHFVDEETIEAIKNELYLDLLDCEELTATRNAVVLYLGEVEDYFDENNNFEMAMQMFTNISGVTAVIDNELFNKGGLY